MTYYLYHIPGKKVGVTTNLEERVHKQQGYYPGEYEIIETSDDIDFISEGEQIMQKHYGYRIDEVPYNKLKFNNMKMKINVTEQTTTFPCPVNKLKGRLMDCTGMTWDTEFGSCIITEESIKWIIDNVKESMYNKERCYVYNKAFARYFDNNSYLDPRVAKALQEKEVCDTACDDCGDNIFDCIRLWAKDRGLYEKGDPKTQYIKLMEEAGEVGRAILKEDTAEIIDGIGDMVVVLTNLAELNGVSIEDCIQEAYNVIAKRTGKMINGTFVKDQPLTSYGRNKN